MIDSIEIKEFNYNLPEEKIAKFPLDNRGDSKLLIYDNDKIIDSNFSSLTNHLPNEGVVMFNNTKVIRARIIFFKDTGARIEIFCLEPSSPSDYERSLSSTSECSWRCMIGNARKWKEGLLTTLFEHDGVSYKITAEREGAEEGLEVVRFRWSGGEISFGELLELLGKIPIPPYLNRDSVESDNERYQTVYSQIEGSVAAPTAGLHFTPQMLSAIDSKGLKRGEVTLHVGAGTFLPVKSDDATQHTMHTEQFSVDITTLELLRQNLGSVTAVGTTTVRTLESIAILGNRVLTEGNPKPEIKVGQWEGYTTSESTDKLLTALINYMQNSNLEQLKCSTSIMITPNYPIRVVDNLITNFHQPQSTLLLLIAAFVGENWKSIYNYALDNNFRFLSYGDSSLLKRRAK